MLKTVNTPNEKVVQSYFGKLKRILIRGYEEIFGLFSFCVCLVSPSRIKKSIQTSKDSNLIVMIVISQVSIDPRVERSARSLVKDGFRIKVYFPENFSSIPDWGPNISFIPVQGTPTSFINRFPYLFGYNFFKEIINDDPLAIHCHDLNTCMIGLAAARVHQSYLICDFHEWFSENVTWDTKSKTYKKHSFLRRATYQLAERYLINESDLTITVCDSIAEQLKQKNRLQKRILVIRNIPSTYSHSVAKREYNLRDELKIPDKVAILLYQGAVGPSRLIEPIIEAMQFTINCHFVIRGPGTEFFGKEYRDLAERLNVLDKISVLPPIPSSDVVDAAKSADIGIWTLPNLSPNFYYALPNKIFEYLSANLPILVANFPEPSKIVEKYNVGGTFDPYNPQSIANSINKLNDIELRKQMAINVGNALTDLDAKNEWEKLREAYREMKKTPPNFRIEA